MSLNKTVEVTDPNFADAIKTAFGKAGDDFVRRFVSFAQGVETISATYHRTNFPSLPEKPITVDLQGKRYVRLWRDRSVHAFVDLTNGDVLKAEGWKKPAKHARGNIYAPDNGLNKMGPYGPEYLVGPKVGPSGLPTNPENVVNL